MISTIYVSSAEHLLFCILLVYTFWEREKDRLQSGECLKQTWLVKLSQIPCVFLS